MKPTCLVVRSWLPPRANFANNSEYKFKFMLALALGRTVEELDASLSLDEFRMWQVFYNINPWGFEVNDAQNAITRHLMASLWSDGKRKLKIEDFRLPLPKKSTRMKPVQNMDTNEWNAKILQAMFGVKKKG